MITCFRKQHNTWKYDNFVEKEQFKIIDSTFVSYYGNFVTCYSQRHDIDHRKLVENINIWSRGMVTWNVCMLREIYSWLVAGSIYILASDYIFYNCFRKSSFKVGYDGSTILKFGMEVQYCFHLCFFNGIEFPLTERARAISSYKILNTQRVEAYRSS
jgi:hypothetical protein